jgi:hypothetical protein
MEFPSLYSQTMNDRDSKGTVIEQKTLGEGLAKRRKTELDRIPLLKQVREVRVVSMGTRVAVGVDFAA